MRKGIVSPTVLAWIAVRGIPTIIVLISIVVLPRMFIAVEPSSGTAEQLVLNHAQMWYDDFVIVNPVTQKRLPATVDMDKTTTTLVYPEDWPRRSMKIAAENNERFYFPQVYRLLDVLVGESGRSGAQSTTSTQYRVVTWNDEQKITEVTVRILEQNS